LVILGGVDHQVAQELAVSGDDPDVGVGAPNADVVQAPLVLRRSHNGFGPRDGGPAVWITAFSRDVATEIGKDLRMPASICATCAVQYPDTQEPPAHCRTCEDERQ
jgi:hypothetical protein